MQFEANRVATGLVAFAVAVAAWIGPLRGQDQPKRDRPPGRQAEREDARDRSADGRQFRDRRGGVGEDAEQGTEEGMPEAKLVVPGEPDARRRWMDNRWRLGVHAYNTDTGVIITGVMPGSPAQRVGLEPRDVIVTVGGYQVGYLEHRLYPLGEELQLRAGPSGRVSLLVQNHRNGELLVLDVRLERYGPRWR